MSTATVTPQQIEDTKKYVLAQWQKAEKMILPAVLDPAHKMFNERIIVQQLYVSETASNPTPENFVTAVTKVAESLKWSTPPAKLTRKNAAPPSKGTVETESQQFQNKAEAARRKSEADAAYAKDQIHYEQAARELVSSFLPMRRNGGGIDERKRQDVRELLSKHIDAEKSRGVSMKEVHRIVAEHIQEEYRKIEKAAEKL